MSFFTNYTHVFKNYLFGELGVPGAASVWTGFFISAKGSRAGKATGAGAFSEGDRYGAVTLVHHWGTRSTTRHKMVTKVPFWSAIGWDDANGFKRFSLMISWMFSLPFVLAASVLWFIGFLPVLVQYGILWKRGALDDRNKSAAKNPWWARLWASFFMIPQLILTGIYRNVFDFSGKVPLQQIALTFLVFSFIFIPSFHLSVGTALSGVGIAGMAFGGLPAILIVGGLVLVALGLYFILSKAEKDILEKLKLEYTQYRMAKKECSSIEEQMVEALRLKPNKKIEFLREIKEFFKDLKPEKLEDDSERRKFQKAFLKKFVRFSDKQMLNQLFILLLDKELKKRLFSQKNKTISRLRGKVRSYAPWAIDLGVASFSLGLVGAIFLGSVNTVFLSAILPYTVPILVASTLMFGLLAYMKVGPRFFTATRKRALFGLLMLVVMLLMLSSVMPPFAAVIAPLFPNHFNHSFILTIFSSILAIGTLFFYKTKIEFLEKEIYPDEIKFGVDGGRSGSYIFRRVVPPYSKKVYYEKIGIEVSKTNDGVCTIYRLKRRGRNDQYHLTMIGPNGIVGMDPTMTAERLKHAPHSISPDDFLNSTQFNPEYKALTSGKNSAGQDYTLIMDGTLAQIEIQKKGKAATVKCSEEGAFEISILGESETKKIASKEGVKAYLKQQGFGGASGMEKIQALGLYEARIVKFDVLGSGKQVRLSNGTDLFCEAGKEPEPNKIDHTFAKFRGSMSSPSHPKSKRESNFSPAFSHSDPGKSSPSDSKTVSITVSAPLSSPSVVK